MKKNKFRLMLIGILSCVSSIVGCDSSDEISSSLITTSSEEASSSSSETMSSEESVLFLSSISSLEGEDMKIQTLINGTNVDIEWESNASVDALIDLLREGSITISTRLYGGFEQVGSLPQSLPSNDTQITTVPGDIMLYNNSSMVFFFGSNTWEYTRLGKIKNLSEDEIRTLLNVSSTQVVISLI